jgi:TfoX/Sxy family transcriptional regulator of competence genes
VPYDEGLAQRVREHLGEGVTEKRMFGGLSFLLHGNMCVGVLHDELITRVGLDRAGELGLPGGRVFDFSGRAMKGWTMVGSGTLGSDEHLTAWIDASYEVAAALPPK